MYDDRKSLEQVFQEHGKVFTGTRARVFNVLSAANQPLSTKDVWERLAESSTKRPDLATVYRTLTAMVQMGVVRKVAHGKNVALYELTQSGGHNHRIVCYKCGRAETLPCSVLSDLAKHVKESCGFMLDHQSMDISGCCPRCKD